MKHDCVTALRLRFEVAPERDLTIRNPEHPLEKATLTGPCAGKGSVQVFREVKWVVLDHVRSFGIRLSDLKQARDDQSIEVWHVKPDGSEEEFFHE